MRRSQRSRILRTPQGRDIRIGHVVRVLSLCLVLSVWTLPARAQEQPAIDASIPAEAATAIDAADWEQVATLLKPLAQAESPGEPIHYWYGVALYHRGDCTMSLHHLNAALELNPRSRVTAHHIARVALAHSILVEPEQLQPALAAFPDDSLILTAVGAVQHEQWARYYKPGRDDTVAWNQLDQACDYLRRAIALDASNVTAHLEMVETLEKLAQWDLAIEHLLMADALEPLGHEAYVMLGQLYAEKGDYSAAADAYTLAVELAPEVPETLEWERGEALLNAGRSAEAVEVFRGIFNANNIHRKVRFMLGRAAYDAGDYTLALHCFRESHHLDQNAQALVWSARCAYDMGQDEAAVKLVNQAIEMAKQKEGDSFFMEALWHFVRGRALWQLGDKKAAMDDLAEAARQEDGNREYATWAIYAFRQLNDPYGVIRVAKDYGDEADPWEAMEVLNQVRKTWVWFPPRKDYQGRTYSRGLIGEWDQAVAELYVRMDRPMSAALLCHQAGWGSKKRVNTWSGWVMLRGGMMNEAQGIFDRLARNGKTEFIKQESHTALALLALQRGDAEAARTHAEAVSEERFQASAETMGRWADVVSGQAGAVDALDPFDLLGIVTGGFDGWRYQRGLYVRALLPGSPLAQAMPPVRPKDVVIRVGDRHFYTWDSVASLRQTPIPEGKTVVLVRRDDKTFDVVVDLGAARAAASEERANKEEPAS